MARRRTFYPHTWGNKLISGRNIKIAFMIQAIVITVALLYIMIQTSKLDQASRWEMDLSEARCRGCCAMHNESLVAIINEPYLSEKLHKFSRAVRKYDIPDDILNILHEAEHKIEQFENELKQFKQEKVKRILQLQDSFIEEDTKEHDLVPKGKPRWKKQPMVKPVTKAATKKQSGTVVAKTTVQPKDKSKTTVKPQDKSTRKLK